MRCSIIHSTQRRANLPFLSENRDLRPEVFICIQAPPDTSTMYYLPINTDIEYNCNSQYFVYKLESDYPTHISCCRAEVKDNIDRLYLNPGVFFK